MKASRLARKARTLVGGRCTPPPYNLSPYAEHKGSCRKAGGEGEGRERAWL